MPSSGQGMRSLAEIPEHLLSRLTERRKQRPGIVLLVEPHGLPARLSVPRLEDAREQRVDDRHDLSAGRC